MRYPILCGIFLIGGLVFAARLDAAPNVTNVSLRGLQIGGTTTVVFEGADLLPNPIVLAPFPIAAQTVRPNAQANRVEIDIQVGNEISPGIFPIRLASGKGISNVIAVGMDGLPQQPFVAETPTLPLAMHGSIAGTQVLTTRFRGTKGQSFVADIEAQRLGANFKPILRIKDAKGKQIAWSPSNARIGGDARATIQLPEDGEYIVEVHDVLFRAASPGFFRLKLGDLKFADFAFPLGIQAENKASVHFASSNLPPDAVTEVDITGRKHLSVALVPIHGQPLFTGSSPRVAVTNHPELVEIPPADGPRQKLPAPPFAVSGRLTNKKEEDQYIFPVVPGSRVQVEVYAQRLGSPLDGVLSLRNEQGTQVATSDDRPGLMDPGSEFIIPGDMTQLVVAIRDLVDRGGHEFVYRIEVTDLARPNIRITADVDRINIPTGATQAVKFQVNRMNYDGPIRLSVEGLPTGVELSGQEIPAGTSIGLMTFTAPNTPVAHSVSRIVAQATGAPAELITVVQAPESELSKRVSAIRDEFAIAVAEPGPLAIGFTGSTDAPMLLGEKLPITVGVQRGPNIAGNARLRLISTQVMPRKKVKENNQEKEVDDLDRALRLEGEPMIAADASQVAVNILVPPDLPAQDWGLVLAADLLAGDNKTVTATVTTNVLTKRPVPPFAVELADAGGIEAKAGLGETGKLKGKIRRQAGFSRAVAITLKGLPKEYASPIMTIPADAEDFEFPVRFSYGAPPAELKEVSLVAVYQPSPQNAELLVQSIQVPVAAIKVVPGEPPPTGEPLAVFEDDEKFVGVLSKGGGTITLDTQEKFTGTAALKVTPDQRFNEMIPTLNVKIRENPGPGEYRYLRFAWKKKGGASVCLQLNHDGAWGPGGSGKPGAKFRYHSGPGGECYGASVVVSDQLPNDFVVVTRDLFADFGDFTLTGISLSPVDGDYAVFDHIYLGQAEAEFEKAPKP